MERSNYLILIQNSIFKLCILYSLIISKHLKNKLTVFMGVTAPLFMSLKEKN